MKPVVLQGEQATAARLSRPMQCGVGSRVSSPGGQWAKFLRLRRDPNRAFVHYGLVSHKQNLSPLLVAPLRFRAGYAP